MRKKFNELLKKFKNKHFWGYFTFILIFIATITPIIVLLCKLYNLKDNANETILTTWIGILSNIAFGALVSMIVLIINDVREHNVQKVLKESIRKREFAKLSNCINSFLSS